MGKHNKINSSNVANEHLLFNKADNHNHLLTADKLISKNADNLAKAEAQTNERPLKAKSNKTERS